MFAVIWNLLRKNTVPKFYDIHHEELNIATKISGTITSAMTRI
jgi:hypothetical protein